MKPSKIFDLLFSFLVIFFLLKGMLSEFGIVERFTQTQIYQFSYLSFGVAAWMFFDKIVIEPMKEKEEESVS